MRCRIYLTECERNVCEELELQQSLSAQLRGELQSYEVRRTRLHAARSERFGVLPREVELSKLGEEANNKIEVSRPRAAEQLTASSHLSACRQRTSAFVRFEESATRPCALRVCAAVPTPLSRLPEHLQNDEKATKSCKCSSRHDDFDDACCWPLFLVRKELEDEKSQLAQQKEVQST